MRLAAGAVALGLVMITAGCSVDPERSARPIVVVSLTASNGRSAAEHDRAMVDRTRRFLERRGVPFGPARFEVLHRSALAAVLVELDEAGDPCGRARWRAALATLQLDPDALVVVVGGTIRSPAPFARRAGVTCSPDEAPCTGARQRAGAIILSDRRPVPGLDPAVVLLHEIGHAADLGHAGQRDRCGGGVAGADGAGDSPANVMQADLQASAGDESTDAVTLDDVALTPAQAKRIAAYLAGTPGRDRSARSPPPPPPPLRGAEPGHPLVGDEAFAGLHHQRHQLGVER